MPVTAKLSREFYERFGDEIANELVEWFNAVDETYQRQLKEVNDLNWARVETRFSAFDERLDAMAGRFDERFKAMSERFDGRLDAMAERFEQRLNAMAERFDEKLGALGVRIDALEVRFDEKLSAMETRFNEKLAAVVVRIESTIDTRIQRLRSELILWMFGFWTATVVPLVGLMLALSGVFRE